jgi:hypothetical protein
VYEFEPLLPKGGGGGAAGGAGGVVEEGEEESRSSDVSGSGGTCKMSIIFWLDWIAPALGLENVGPLLMPTLG